MQMLKEARDERTWKETLTEIMFFAKKKGSRKTGTNRLERLGGKVLGRNDGGIRKQQTSMYMKLGSRAASNLDGASGRPYLSDGVFAKLKSDPRPSLVCAGANASNTDPNLRAK